MSPSIKIHSPQHDIELLSSLCSFPVSAPFQSLLLSSTALQSLCNSARSWSCLLRSIQTSLHVSTKTSMSCTHSTFTGSILAQFTTDLHSIVILHTLNFVDSRLCITATPSRFILLQALLAIIMSPPVICRAS